MPTTADLRRRARVALIVRARGPRDGDGDGFYTPFKGAPDRTPMPPKAPPGGVAGYRRRLRGMDDDTLAESLRVLDAGRVPLAADDAKAARRAVQAEIRRRRRSAAQERERQTRYEALRAEGHDELAAWALATGKDPEKVRDRMERLGRPSVAQMRRDWELIVESELAEAEQVTNGQMVKPEGRLRYDRARRANVSVNPRDFWRRNSTYVGRWASDEFKQWAASRGGFTTFEAYRAMVEGQNVRDTRTRENRRLGEFG